VAADREERCPWAAGSDSMIRYHDTEWGFAVSDDRSLFEKICLEGFQSGLSWSTILNKRDAFREVFHGFDPTRVASMGPRDVERLLGDARIVRHRGKIESAIANAGRVADVVAEFGSFAEYVWRFEPPRREGALPWDVIRTFTTSPESVALSKDLKKRGWSFVGPTTMYAFMQSMGLVNDHAAGCPAHGPAERSRQDLRPTTRRNLGE
jgi:DNA-3-methyladenine glycosylase I